MGRTARAVQHGRVDPSTPDPRTERAGDLPSQARALAQDYADLLSRVHARPERWLDAPDGVRERLSHVLQRGPATVWLVEEVARRCAQRGRDDEATDLWRRAGALRDLDAL